MKQIQLLSAVASMACLAAAPALAANAPTDDATQRGTQMDNQTMTPTHPRAETSMKGSPDQAFMLKAAKGGLMEVELGAVAVRRGGRDSKIFGAQMVKDHGAANKQLAALATKLGVTLPKAPDPQQMVEIKRLEKLQGMAFDNAYLRLMHEDHANDIKEFKSEVANGKDAQVKAWAAKSLPVLQGHYAMDHRLMANHPGMDTSPMGAHRPMTGGGAGH